MPGEEQDKITTDVVWDVDALILSADGDVLDFVSFTGSVNVRFAFNESEMQYHTLEWVREERLGGLPAHQFIVASFNWASVVLDFPT